MLPAGSPHFAQTLCALSVCFSWAIVSIHNLNPEVCAVCSGYVRWLIEDDARIAAAQSNPKTTRQRYREIRAEGEA